MVLLVSVSYARPHTRRRIDKLKMGAKKGSKRDNGTMQVMPYAKIISGMLQAKKGAKIISGMLQAKKGGKHALDTIKQIPKKTVRVML
jgi:hypothetical protein